MRVYIPDEIIRETIRDHIDSCGARMVSVAFYKKDGSLRHMRINGRALLDSLVNSERGNRAAETRRQNHPELKPVPEITKDGAQWRSVNLDKVLTVRSGGRIMRYRDKYLNPIVAIQIGRFE